MAATTSSCSGKAIEDYWTTIGRVDHAFSDKNRMFVRFHRDFWEEDKNRSFGNDVNGIILNRINRGIALDDVHMISPTLVLNFRYGITQQEFPERRVSQGFDLASLGFSTDVSWTWFPKDSARFRTSRGLADHAQPVGIGRRRGLLASATPSSATSPG